MSESRTRIFLWSAAAFCVAAVLSRIWVAEDAYITFRAVENLYAGHGLVYNPGERTEVFTHPLWMLLLVIVRGAGLPLHTGSILLGLAFSFAGLALLLFDRRDANDDGPGMQRRLVRSFPLAALALCSISGFRDFATAGMEYSLVFFLLVLLVRRLEGREVAAAPAAVAALCGLLYLARPELGLLVAFYGLALAWECLRGLPDLRRVRIAPMIIYSLAALAVILPYHIFRALYFQDIFPNTYYAKAGLSTYYIQGLRYAIDTLLRAPALWILLAILALAPAFHRTRSTLAPRLYPGYFRELAAAALLALYILRVGGDFMAFRFFLPEIILAALVADRFFRAGDGDAFLRALPGLRRLPADALHFGGLALFVLLSFWPTPLSRGSIADERRIFFEESNAGPLALLLGQRHEWGLRGAEFRELRECLGLESIWITNSQAQAQCLKGAGLGYFGVAAGPGVRILDEQALPNRDVANLPVLYRWRPGHEHYLDLSHAIGRGVAFCSSGEPAVDRTMAVNAGIVLSLDPELLATLPDVRARLERLVELKRAGSVVLPVLEERYGVRLEELAQRAAAWERDGLLNERRSCWAAEGPLGRDYFY